MLFADLVACSGELAGTSSRSRKVAIIAELLQKLDPDEIPIAVSFLSGVPLQGRIGIGYAIVYGVGDEHPAGEEPSLMLADVDRAITEIQASVGSGSAGDRKRILGAVFGRATEPEAGFLRRLFTGELRQGALEGVMLEAIALAAEVPSTVVRRALQLSGNLAHTGQIALVAGESGLRDIGLEIFRPIRPMLASTAESVAQAIEGFDLASVEWKLDGIRIQIHRRDEEVRIYTRGLNEITDALKGIADTIRRLPVREVLLDGEALWMNLHGPASFQETMSQIDSNAPLEGIETFIFDILHVDGEDLIDVPLQQRAAKLDAIAPKLRIPSVVTSNADEAQRALDEALAAGHEGVVVKDARSLYVAGRRGKAWRKVKPVRTYDLVVIGAEWGHGRRQGWLSNLYLAARDPGSNEFVMVGKCFKGLTDELLGWQTQALLKRETERRGNAVLVRPELVVEIAIDGVQSSTRYSGGVALRFARVKRYRDDKDPAEADTIDTLRELRGRPDKGNGAS